MPERAKISASLLAADYGMMRNALQRAEAAGVDRFHFDFMDGHYVPNLALTPEHIRALRPYSDLPFDVHLELANPKQVIQWTDWEGVSTIILQADSLKEYEEVFEIVRSLNMRLGLAVNPEHELGTLDAWLPEVDELLVLGVHPGFGGQRMHPSTCDRLRKVARQIATRDLEIALSVDGGVKITHVPDLVEAGANVLVVGTGLFGSNEIERAVSDFRSSIADN